MVLKNKKGQVIIVKIMFAILLFIAVMIFFPVVDQQISLSQNQSSNLNCSASDNNAVTEGTCIILDLGLFYFIASCIAVGLAFITGRKTIQGVLTAIFTTLLVLILITPLKDFINIFRDAEHLACATGTLSVGQNLLCIFVDLWLFYFVAVAISSAITYITLREFLPEDE